MHWKRSNPNCNGNGRDKVALRTTCIQNVTFQIIKIRAGFQYVGYFCYSETLNWAAQNFRLGRMRPVGCELDIAALAGVQWDEHKKVQLWKGRFE